MMKQVHSSKKSKQTVLFGWNDIRTRVVLVSLFFLLITLPLLLVASSRNQYIPGKASGCNDGGCVNYWNGSGWQITNCNVSDPDGDQQLCTGKGRVGICRGVNYCCPGAGAQWTSDMTNCPTPTQTPTKTPTPIPTKAPTSIPTKVPTAIPTKTPTPIPTKAPTKIPTKIPTPIPTKVPTRVPTRIPTKTPTPSPTLTGTPTPTTSAYTFMRIPSVTPTPTPVLEPPTLSVEPLGGTMAPTFTLKGKATPYADVEIVIGQEQTYTTTADAKGEWRYIVTRPLSVGKKELTVTARNAGGASQEYKQTFEVKKSSGISPWLIILIILAVGSIGYAFYRRHSER